MIKRTTLTEKAYNILKQMILEGDLKPGEPLVQEQLSAKLGISRTPLLHALKILESENLIVRANNQRVFVRQFAPEEVLVLFEMREALEGLAAKYITPLVNEEEISTFEESFTKAYLEKNIESYRKADVSFHLFVAEKCPYLDLKSALIRSGFLAKCLIKGLIRPPEETHQEHMEILRCFRNRDPEGAERAMRLHIQKTISCLKNYAGQLPAKGEHAK
ncbi:GntR family transcriptional regulator [Atrimonas thermophila]|jgi:DNA-binding GntR family transcriptional regulator|uniref:GntR family transcriptional regulator n=1 Tax=Atrimonas thermophila TaxID=3064161 RepID=UPI00399CD682